MKTLLATAAALAVLTGAALADGHAKTIRLGTEGAYPPYNFLNDDGEVAGFEREVGDELCARAELTCEWVTNEWDSIIPNLVSGNYDVIIAGMSITAERDEVIDFSDPYTQPDPSAFVAMSDMDMSSAVIAAQSGTPSNLVTAAGIIETASTVLDADLEAHDRLWAINYGGTLNACRSFGRLMRTAGTGSLAMSAATATMSCPARRRAR